MATLLKMASRYFSSIMWSLRETPSKKSIRSFFGCKIQNAIWEPKFTSDNFRWLL